MPRFRHEAHDSDALAMALLPKQLPASLAGHEIAKGRQPFRRVAKRPQTFMQMKPPYLSMQPPPLDGLISGRWRTR